MTKQLKLKPTTKKIIDALFDADAVHKTYLELLEKAIAQANIQIDCEVASRIEYEFVGEDLEQSENMEKELSAFIELTEGAMKHFEESFKPQALKDLYFKELTTKLDMTEDEFIVAAKPLIKENTLELLKAMTDLSEKVLTEVDEQCYNVSESKLLNKSQVH